MNADTIAILGVAGTFIVPFIVLFLEKYAGNKIYIRINSNRKKRLEGKWTGIYTGLPGDKVNTTESTFELTFRVGRRKIIGKGVVRGEKFNDSNNRLYFEGGFRNDRFLILNYDNHEVLQFGTMIFELKPTNDKLAGKLVGFGHHSETIVLGDIILQKVKQKS